jgi:voltage-gated potassium channel
LGRALDVSALVIWAVFLLDFAANLLAAPSALRYLRRNWLSAAMLLVPALRLLRLAALLRLGRALPAARVVSNFYRATGVARQLLRSPTAFLAGIAVVVTLALGQLIWLLERDHGTFAGFGDALMWAASTVIAMQGDPCREVRQAGS